MHVNDERSRRKGEAHADGRWCEDLHCSKCYSADTWQKKEQENASLRADNEALRAVLRDVLDDAAVLSADDIDPITEARAEELLRRTSRLTGE